MDTPNEYRQMEYEERYRYLFGCYPDEEVYEDEADREEIEKERVKIVRKSLGWN